MPLRSGCRSANLERPWEKDRREKVRSGAVTDEVIDSFWREEAAKRTRVAAAAAQGRWARRFALVVLLALAAYAVVAVHTALGL